MATPKNRSAQTQLRVGRLTKAHGLKGGLKLELFTDDPDRRFTPGASFALQVPTESPWHGRRLVLAELRWYNAQPVGFFEDVADRTAAESLVKAILWVDQDPEEAAEPDAWYDHQLVGLDVVRDGTVVGTIDRLEHLPAQDLLVVAVGGSDGVERREVLVPFVRAIVPEVDVEGRRVVVTPPEGLFEDLPDEDERPRLHAVPPVEDDVDDAARDAEADAPDPGAPASGPDDAPASAPEKGAAAADAVADAASATPTAEERGPEG